MAFYERKPCCAESIVHRRAAYLFPNNLAVVTTSQSNSRSEILDSWVKCFYSPWLFRLQNSRFFFPIRKTRSAIINPRAKNFSVSPQPSSSFLHPLQTASLGFAKIRLFCSPSALSYLGHSDRYILKDHVL